MLKQILFTMATILTFASHAQSVTHSDLDKAPPPLLNELGMPRGTFVDILKADYDIVYDYKNKVVQATSTLKFEMKQPGRPIFDLVPHATHVEIDGKLTQFSETNTGETTLQVLVMFPDLVVGKHTIKVRHPIQENVKFSDNGVHSGFWMGDVMDRGFLEQYLLTNLEYDQYPMTINVRVVGTDQKHTIKTNGKLTQTGVNTFQVVTPATFNCSSLFFHLFPEGYLTVKEFSYESIDGRVLPITVYSDVYKEEYAEQVKHVLTELEQDYGPWPHPSFIGYLPTDFPGGMEYAGATITHPFALQHEMFHSYFARGVMPANGNMGWFDEAVASWRDNGYPQFNEEDLIYSNVANNSPYRRFTDVRSYKTGRTLLGFLDKELSGQGGMKSFLKSFFAEKKLTVILNEDLFQSLDQYFNREVSVFFKEYLFQEKPMVKSDSEEPQMLEKIHNGYTKKDLLRIL